jgi:hypothetical protein
MTPDPLALDRFNACLDIDNGYVIIADRDHTPLTGEVADRILGDSEADVIWNTSDRLGYIIFPTDDAGWSMAQTLADQLNDLDAKADAEQADALSIDYFTARLDHDRNHVVVISRDAIPLTSPVADCILGGREAAAIWYTADRYGYVVFPATDDGWARASALAAKLNDLCAQADAAADAEQAADAAQADALIDDAATLAEQIEAADGLTATQRRGLAAYQRAAALPRYQWSADCGERWAIGDRVQIGDPADPYRCGVIVGLGLSVVRIGQTATVILADSPWCPLIVLTDADEVIALPHPSLYVRRAE